jgi:hypothetical protein
MPSFTRWAAKRHDRETLKKIVIPVREGGNPGAGFCWVLLLANTIF